MHLADAHSQGLALGYYRQLPSGAIGDFGIKVLKNKEILLFKI